MGVHHDGRPSPPVIMFITANLPEQTLAPEQKALCRGKPILAFPAPHARAALLKVGAIKQHEEHHVEKEGSGCIPADWTDQFPNLHRSAAMLLEDPYVY